MDLLMVDLKTTKYKEIQASLADGLSQASALIKNDKVYGCCVSRLKHPSAEYHGFLSLRWGG